MALITGMAATIGGFSCVADFNVTNIGFDNGVGCSSSQGKIVRTSSGKDWEALCHGYGTAAPALPGAGVSMVSNAVGGPGIVDWIEVICNTGDPQGVVEWKLHCKACNLAAVALTPSGTLPTPTSVIGRGVGGGGGRWKLRAINYLTAPVWLSASDWPERAAGYSDAQAEWEWYFGAGSAALPSVGQAASVTLLTYTVTGICTAAGSEVVVHNRQNQAEYQRGFGKIAGTLS